MIEPNPPDHATHQVVTATTEAGPPAPSVAVARVAFVDVARSIAIVGALTLHALVAFKVWDQMPPGYFKGLANGFFRYCTPTFFLLFGVMLEWVYVKHRERDGAAAAARRLVRRAGLCYLGLALGACAALVGGKLTLDQLPGALVGWRDVPMSSVLRFYTIAMLVAIPVVVLRPRLGVLLPVALVAAIWLIGIPLALLPWPAPGAPSAFLTGFLFGHPGVWGGGSVWYDLSLVFLGMALGWHMRARLLAGRHPLGGWPVAALVLICLTGTAASAWQLGRDALIWGYLGTAMQLRMDSHPAYFCIATLSSLVVIAGVLVVYPPDFPGSRVRLPIIAFGRHSLLAFALGNAALNLVPRTLAPPVWLGLIMAACYLTGLCLVMHYVAARARR